MPKFDEGNRKRGIQGYLEASKATDAAMNTKGIDSTFSEKGNQLSYEKTAAGMGAAGGFGSSTYRHDESFNRVIEASLSKIREEVSRTAPLCNSTAKEKDMGLHLDSMDYKDFLRLIEESRWVRPAIYKIFFNNNIMQGRLLEAICSKRVKYQIRSGEGEIIDDGIRELDENEKILMDEIYLKSSDWSDSIYLEGKSFLAWLNKEYPYEGEAQAEHNETEKEKISESCLADILNLITPEMYPDGLKGQEKSAITNSLKTLKGQIPKAFELCSALVMEAMPCKEREEYLQYFRDDIITRAKEKGINRPTALQIYQGLPAMLKK